MAEPTHPSPSGCTGLTRARPGRLLFAVAALAAGVWLPPAAAAEPSGAPRRIVSVSPNATEILYAVGAFDRVVAVSRYCTYPPQVKEKERVGAWQDINLEQLAGLKPDLVVMTDAQAHFLEARLRQLGIRSIVIRGQTLEDVFNAIEETGRAAGAAARAGEVIAETRTALEEVRRRAAAQPRRRVLLVVDRTPGTLRDLYVATAGSYLDDLVTIAGGELVAAPARLGWGRMTKEAIVALDPDVILDIVHFGAGTLGEDPLLVWNDLAGLRAVREGRVRIIREDYVVHPSQRIADTARLLGRLIHPEAFSAGRSGSGRPAPSIR